MSSIPPTLPFHLAKAYGVQAAKPLTVRPLSTDPIARIDQGRAAGRANDSIETTRPGGGVSSLVGAKVNVPAFEGLSNPTPLASERSEAFPFYRHPADRNAAATAVNLGRSLDVSG
ncbi:MAG: hypothetical protein R3B57_02955 [Phycisphaerales bacterium]